jgi:hypothetical protein
MRRASDASIFLFISTVFLLWGGTYRPAGEDIVAQNFLVTEVGKENWRTVDITIRMQG